MGSATLLCWGAVGAVLSAVDPFATSMFGIALFYGSLALALMGTFALAGIIIRKVFFHEEPRFVQVAVAFRQSILFAFLVVTLLMLSHAQLLRWWLIPVVIAFFTVIEYLLLSISQHRRPTASSSSG